MEVLMESLLRRAFLDMIDILPEFESSGDRLHPGWQTLWEIEQAISEDSGLFNDPEDTPWLLEEDEND